MCFALIFGRNFALLSSRSVLFDGHCVREVLFSRLNYYCVKYVFDTKRDSNLNNTCFANGVLQAVLSVERFLKGLQDIQHNREKCLAKQAGELWCFTTTLQP